MIVWTKYKVIYEVGAPLINRKVGEDNTAHTPYMGASLYRKEIFNKLGLFDETLRFIEDTDWWLRALDAKTTIQKIDFIGILYRRYHHNMTIDLESQSMKNMLGLLRKTAARRKNNDQNV